MSQDHRLETLYFLDEPHLETFCDSLFQTVEEEYVDQNEFETTFKSLGKRLPLENEWFEKKRSEVS